MRAGAERVYVGYAIDGGSGRQYADLDDIRVTDAEGREISWRHQTATGVPAGIVALEEPSARGAASAGSGRADGQQSGVGLTPS